MKIIILGSNGMLGSMLSFIAKRYNKDILSLNRNDFELGRDNINTLIQFFNQPCCIVNCIGAIPQKKYNNDNYTLLNIDFPLQLSELCKAYNIPLIHISTNCVFSGEKSNCLENDIPDANDMYGLSKYKGEPSNCTVLRCSIIGPEKTSSYGLMEWFLHKNDDVNGYTDHYWNGLTTLELSKIILNIVDEKKFINGIYHYYSNNMVSKFELLEIISKYSNNHVKITPVENGVKYYTLHSIYNNARISIDNQIKDLFEIMHDYRLSAV